MEVFLGALFIFCLRIGDVSIGTLRVMFLVNGKRTPATVLAFVESAIWILAISRVFKELDGHPGNMLAYASGYACGTLVGMTAERLLAFGQVMVRVITRDASVRMKDLLAGEGYGVTEFSGQGVGGDVKELMIVIPRRRRVGLLTLVHQIDPKAFVIVETITQSVGGYLPRTIHPAA